MRHAARVGRAILPLLALFIALTALAVPARAQGWQPLEPGQARLTVAPSAFGTEGIQRWVLDDRVARYERWATAFDPGRRFFQLVLREAKGTVSIREDFDLARFVAESWGGRDLEQIRWGTAGRVETPLGPADYRRFGFGPIGCAAFQTGFGGMIGDFPANMLKGLYCDPTVLQIPDFDLEATLGAIGAAPAVSR